MSAVHPIAVPARAHARQHPHLRLVSSVADHGPLPHEVYVRRRVVALFFVVTAVLVSGLGLRIGGEWALSRLDTSSQAPQIQLASASADVEPPSAVTVRPGDTLWSIARAVQPTGDIRPLLQRLHDEYAGQPLVPGSVIAVPGS